MRTALILCLTGTAAMASQADVNRMMEELLMMQRGYSKFNTTDPVQPMGLPSILRGPEGQMLAFPSENYATRDRPSILPKMDAPSYFEDYAHPGYPRSEQQEPRKKMQPPSPKRRPEPIG